MDLLVTNKWASPVRRLSLYFLLGQQLASAQASYYVDLVNGLDANPGTSKTLPWKTIAKINSRSFSPGDSILLNRGDTWPERLEPPSSGTASHPIVFDSYGSGAIPVLSGIYMKGTNYNWISNLSIQNSPLAGVYLERSNNNILSNLSVSGSYNDGIDLSVESSSNLIENCTTHSNGHGPPGLYHGSGILAEDGASMNTVTGCTSYSNAEDGISFSGFWPSGLAGTYNTASNNLCYGNTEDGIDIKNGPQIITGNTLHDNTDYGIICDYNVDSLTIQNNIIYSNTNGINFTHTAGGPSSDTNYVRRNLIYSNRRSGISLNDTSFTSQVAYNVIYNNVSNGIICWTGHHSFYNNTIWNNASDGSSQIQISTPNTILKNNIIGGGSSTVINFSNTAGQISDYNDLYATTTDLEWGGTKYTLAEYKTSTTQDANSISEDPLFEIAGSDFHLQAGSPCINAGTNVGLTTDFDGHPVVVTPDTSIVDIGAFSFTQNAIDVLPGLMQFGRPTIGQQETMMLTITNTGAARLIIDTIRTTDKTFSVSRHSLIISPAATETIAVSFLPTKVHNYTASLTLQTGTSAVHTPIPLVGVGSPVTPSPENSTPRSFFLNQNFPNPFNPSTIIRYEISQLAFVKVELFDVLGRTVKTLVDEEQEAGIHEVVLDASALSSGTYFYRMRAANFVSSRKCLVLK
jgi:parallel beta-helix repeat protein